MRAEGSAGTPPCLIFLHVPKTGGVTLRATLRQKYPGVHLTMHSPRDPSRIAEIPADRRRRARVVSGHLPHGVHRYMPGPCEYITMLREPVARAVSTYHHILEHPQHWFHDQLVASGMNLEEFVAGEDGPADNLQVRLLSGCVKDELVRADGSEVEVTAAGRAALERAEQNTAECLVAGLTERFDESFILLRRALGWRLPMYAKRNTGRHGGRAPVTPGAAELIIRRDQLDVQLVAHVHRLLDGAIDAQGPSFARELAAFRVLNRVPSAVGPLLPRSLRNPLHSARHGRIRPDRGAGQDTSPVRR